MPYYPPASSSGSGTVTATGGSLTSNSVVLGAGTTDTKVVAGITSDGASQITLGVNATTIGKLKFFGNTSGDATIQPSAVAGTATVLTLPATTDTLVGKATTDTLTNKTLTSPTLTSPVLGTPASGNLANCTALPVSSITASTSTALGVGSVELGHATDTTLSRSSAGVLAVEGVVVPTVSSTSTLTNKTLTSPVINTPTGIVKGDVGLGNVDNTSNATERAAAATLTNKRIPPRTGTTTSSGTPTINTDNVDFYSLTAQTVDITSFTTNLSGTPTDGQKLWISITGTAARAITWGASFEASTTALPATTVTTARLDVGFIWNAATSKWRCVGTC